MPMQAAAAAPLTEEDRATIRSIIAKFDQDMLAGNRPALVAIYSDDAILMPPNAPMVRGRIEIQQFFEAFPKVTEFTQNPVEIAGEGDLAFPWGTYEMAVLPADATKPVKDSGKVLGVWRKQPDGMWPGLLADFDAEHLRGWAAELGVETFVASTGRVYPRELKAAPLLRRWVQRLRSAGVSTNRTDNR